MSDAVHTDPIYGSATISADGLYRYRLTRQWAIGAPMTFVMYRV